MRHCLHGLLVLVCLCGAEAAHARGDFCKRVLLEAGDRAAMLAEARRISEHEPDLDSLSICKRQGGLNAFLNTIRVDLPDGTQHWHSVGCNRGGRYGPKEWRCGASQYQAFRAHPYPDTLGVWVTVPHNMPLEDGKALAHQSFALIAGSGTLDPCYNERGPPKSFSDLRALLTGGNGVLLFSNGLSRVTFKQGDFTLYLKRGVPAAGPVLDCWYMFDQADIVVTAMQAPP